MAAPLKGKDTPEYKAVKQKFNQIVKLYMPILLARVLATELSAKTSS